MKRAVTWGLGLYLLCAVVGRLAEGVGVVRCGCSEDCWCKRPGMGPFRWVFPVGHRSAVEPVADVAPMSADAPVEHAPVADEPLETEKAVRYWLYKTKSNGGPEGSRGDWASEVFASAGPTEWGGHSWTRSAEVGNALNDLVAPGDVMVAYQTDLKAVIGYLRLTHVAGPRDERKLLVQPIHRIDPPFPIHEHKAGTSLATSPAVQGPVMLRELSAEEMRELVDLSGAPMRVLRGQEPVGGWRP